MLLGAEIAGCYCGTRGAGVASGLSGHLGLVHISTMFAGLSLDTVRHGWDDSRQSRVGVFCLFPFLSLSFVSRSLYEESIHLWSLCPVEREASVWERSFLGCSF